MILKSLYCASHRFYGLKLCALILIINLSLYKENYSQSTVWLLKNPESLTIYNRFEQRFTDLSTWHLFVPVILLNESDYLSDGFTKVIRIQHQNQPYFIQLTNEQKVGNIRQVFRNPQWKDKIVQLKRKVTLELSAFPGSQPEVLEEGKFLFIAFRNGDRLYAQSPSTQRWGWITLPTASESAFFKAEEKTTSHDTEENLRKVYDILQKEIQSINHLISTISEIKNLVIYPQFKLTEQPKKLSISWTNMNQNDHWDLVKKTFAQRIETMLLGTGFKLILQSNEWIVVGQDL